MNKLNHSLTAKITNETKSVNCTIKTFVQHYSRVLLVSMASREKCTFFV